MEKRKEKNIVIISIFILFLILLLVVTTYTIYELSNMCETSLLIENINLKCENLQVLEENKYILEVLNNRNNEVMKNKNIDKVSCLVNFENWGSYYEKSDNCYIVD